MISCCRCLEWARPPATFPSCGEPGLTSALSGNSRWLEVLFQKHNWCLDQRPVYSIIDLNLSLRCRLGSMTQCLSFSRRTIVPQAKVKTPRTRASPSPSDPSPSSSRPSASTSPCSRTSPSSRTRPRSPSSSLTPSQSNSSTMCPSISRTWKQQKERQATCTRTWRIGKSVFFSQPRIYQHLCRHLPLENFEGHISLRFSSPDMPRVPRRCSVTYGEDFGVMGLIETTGLLQSHNSATLPFSKWGKSQI